MIIGVNTPIYSEGSLEEKTERILNAGYKGLGVGFSVADDCGKWIGDMDENDIARHKKVLSKFKTSSIHASHSEMKPLALHPRYREISQNEYIMNLEMAGKLSVPTVVMHPMEPKEPNLLWDGCGYDPDEIMKEFMLKIDAVAGENNVKACWETGCGYFNPFEKFDLIRELGLKHTGICLDVGHMMLVWNNFGVGINKKILTIKDFILRYGDIIYDLHIHDWVKDKEKTPHGWNDHNLVGTGEIDWEEVFRALVETGYNGILTCEYHPLVVENDDRKLAENRKYICDLITSLGGKAE